jgi:poly(A) polymerase
MKLELSEITIEKIKNGELREAVPELYELEEIIENNLSHSNESTLTHILSVRKELELLLEDVDKSIKSYLDLKIDSHSRKELLLFASLFHDIAKKETIKKQGDKSTFPGHEKASAEKVQKILQRFALSDSERDFVVRIIKHHGLLYDLPEGSDVDIERKVSEFKNEQLDIYIAVVLHTKADLLANQLKYNNPEAFKLRLDFLNILIEDSCKIKA